MYQGKFDAKAKGQSAPGQTLEEILKERSAAQAAQAARQAQQAVPPPVAAEEPDLIRRKKPAPKPEPAPKTTKTSKAAKPARAPENQKVQPPKKKGIRLGSVLFYTLYFLSIFAFFVGVFAGLNWLNGWLKAFELAQPTVKCQEVFNTLFRDPDWAKLYRIAGVADSEFEGIEEYVAYMDSKVGSQELNYVETSAGITRDKKYIVRLGTEKLATFTLTAGDTIDNDIPDWQMGQVDLIVNRNLSCQIKKVGNHTAYVNGVPLDDSYTIQTGYTVADEMLPSGTPKLITSIQRVEGLMAPPHILIFDEGNVNRLDVVYNPETDMYEEQVDSIVISEEERAVVFGALEAFSGFMINASGSTAAVNKYFDSSSKSYSDIIAMGKELWMNADRGHEFQNEEILGYTKHSDTLFSVRASLNMHVNAKDNTERDFGVVESMFFTKKNGNWVCTEMMNLDITQPIGQVRLTFCTASGDTISTGFYDTNAEMLTTPSVEAPAGKTFSGWSRIETAANGSKAWTIMFRPDEAGNVYLNGAALEPMTLYPLFE